MAAGIHIVREPKVYLVGRQQVDEGVLQEFLEDHEVDGWTTDTDVGAEKLCEVAGRLCYLSYARPRPGGNKAYLGHILGVGHGSVAEHAAWNFIIAGVSRSFSHELVRHRAGFAYSQLSQRYVDESVAEYIQPAVIAADPEASRVWEEAVMACHGAYLRLVERLTALVTEAGYRAYVEAKKAEGLPAYAGDRDWWLRNEADRTALRKEARQAARSVLPNATETKVFVTANARALRHTIEMRCSRFAEPEIRKVFMRVLVLMQQEAPALFGDYERVTLPDGTWEAVTRHRKV
jgi:thymidylate synthase (FAD)